MSNVTLLYQFDRLCDENNITRLDMMRVLGNVNFYDPDADVWFRLIEEHTSKPKPPKRGKWHRVEDKMPPTQRDVSVFIGGRQLQAYWNGANWWDSFWQKQIGIVTHWRELPKPPKEKARE